MMEARGGQARTCPDMSNSLRKGTTGQTRTHPYRGVRCPVPLETEKETSRAREPEPLFECRGHWFAPFGTSVPWLWIWSRAAGRVLGLRPSQLSSEGTLLTICPDVDHWRRNFPDRKGSSGIDCVRASATLIAECYRAGLKKPPPDVAIRGPGRPRTA